MRKLTIGMCCYDDYEGVFFTIQSLRMYHPEVMDQVEFVIIDNHPNSKHGKLVKEFTGHIRQPFQYIPFDEYNATGIKNLIFEHAKTPYVMSIDCHVLIRPGAIKKLIEYYDQGLDKGNLLQGPLIHDCLSSTSTFFNKKWGSHMMGQWDRNENLIDYDSEPFPINSQGMGLFSSRKENWLGYSPLFRGFGGEEQYIHDKYRKAGKEALCLPFLGWMHRFNRVNGVPYPNKLDERYRNYIIGRMELDMDFDDVDENFKDALSDEIRSSIKAEVAGLLGNKEVDVKAVAEAVETPVQIKSKPTVNVADIIKRARAQNS